MPHIRASHLGGTVLGLAALAASIVYGWQTTTTTPQEASPAIGSSSAEPTAPARSRRPVPLPEANELTQASTVSRRAVARPPNVERALSSRTEPAAEQARIIEALERRVTELEAHVRRQDRNLRNLQESARAAEPIDLDEATIAALADEERRLAEEAELQVQDRIWALESRFDFEQVDPHWSAAATLEVNDAITGTGIDGAHVIDLDCRASTCRVEVDFSSPDAQAEVEVALARLPFELAPGNAPGDTFDTGTSSRTYYMTRPDESAH